MTEADTTKAAATAMRNSRIRRKESSGDIQVSSRRKPGPITTTAGVARKPSNSIFETDGPRRMGPGLRRDDNGLHPLHRHRNLRTVPDGLIDHAIALGQLQQEIELVLRRIGRDLEAQADFGEADRCLLVDAERAAEIEIALGNQMAGLQRHLHRGS